MHGGRALAGVGFEPRSSAGQPRNYRKTAGSHTARRPAHAHRFTPTAGVGHSSRPARDSALANTDTVSLRFTVVLFSPVAILQLTVHVIAVRLVGCGEVALHGDDGSWIYAMRFAMPAHRGLSGTILAEDSEMIGDIALDAYRRGADSVTSVILRGSWRPKPAHSDLPARTPAWPPTSRVPSLEERRSASPAAVEAQ